MSRVLATVRAWLRRLFRRRKPVRFESDEEWEAFETGRDDL